MMSPRAAWEGMQAGTVQLLDLRTALERRRFGSPPGAVKAPLLWHALFPRPDAVYLCQHAVRSKLPTRRGAMEVTGGFVAWKRAGLPITPGRPDEQLIGGLRGRGLRAKLSRSRVLGL